MRSPFFTFRGPAASLPGHQSWPTFLPMPCGCTPFGMPGLPSREVQVSDCGLRLDVSLMSKLLARRDCSRFRCGQSLLDCFDTRPNQCSSRGDPKSIPPGLRGGVLPDAEPFDQPPGALSFSCVRTRMRQHRQDSSGC